MVKNKKIRSTNIEILRIVAMLMIVIFHIVCHCISVQLVGGDSVIKIGNDLFNNPVFSKRLFLLDAIMTWGTTGNALFVLISGYFLVHSKKGIDIHKISKKLLLQLGFASVVLVTFSTLIYRIHITDKFIRLIDINLFNSLSCFIGYYFLVILIAYLFLNKYLNKFNKKQYITFLIIVFALTQFGWTNQIVNGFSDGLSTLLTGVFYYSLGGYINKYNPFSNVRVISILLIIVIIYLLVFISSYNLAAIRIENYYINPANGFTQNVMTFGNSNILVAILSICIFELFTRVKIKNIRFINYVASGTLMIYLIHDNPLFYSLWGMIDWISLLYYNLPKFIIALIGVGLLTFMFGIIVYVFFDLTIKLIVKYKNLFLKKTN